MVSHADRGRSPAGRSTASSRSLSARSSWSSALQVSWCPAATRPSARRWGTAGLFQVNVLHNVVHLAIGAVLIAAALRGDRPARTANRAFGVLYLVLFVAGLFLVGTGLNLVALNASDNILHLVLGSLSQGWDSASTGAETGVTRSCPIHFLLQPRTTWQPPFLGKALPCVP